MRQSKVLHLFEMLIVCAVGLYLILNPREALETALKVLAIALTACGAVAVIVSVFMWTKQEQRKRALAVTAAGLAALAAGIFLLVTPFEKIDSFFSKIAGVLIAFSGILNLVKAIDTKKAGGKAWQVLLALAILTIVLGAFVFTGFFGIADMTTTVVVIVGVILIYNGVLGIIAALGE